MRSTLLLFLLLPVFTFSQNKLITWEKEGIKGFNYIYNNFKEVHSKTKNKKEILDSCSLLFLIINENKYSSKKQVLEIKKMNVGQAFFKLIKYSSGENKQKSELFINKCLKYQNEKNALFQKLLNN